MKKQRIARSLYLISVLLIVTCSEDKSTKLYFPDKDLGQLFIDVQTSDVFPDQKTFVDCAPKTDPAKIVKLYEKLKKESDFDLKEFIYDQFEVSEKFNKDSEIEKADSIEEHLTNLWDVLTQTPDTGKLRDSKIPLKHPYIVPGGRFREIFYWDSYFTILGLLESGRSDLAKGMLDNFADLIDQIGFIPNGNRTYFITRSQPPFFAAMVMAYAEKEGMNKAVKYISVLEKEYAFWMNTSNEDKSIVGQVNRIVQVSDTIVLNRYWDSNNGPRAEAFARELPLAKNMDDSTKTAFYKHIRAACESGWDFSSRWFADGESMESISAANVLPVDLNCLVYNLEASLSVLFEYTRNTERAQLYRNLADSRKANIRTLFWSDSLQYFTDYHFLDEKLTETKTLAGVVPLYFEAATKDQAAKVAETIENEFLQAGGVVTTLVESGEQWDFPNGWAPLAMDDHTRTKQLWIPGVGKRNCQSLDEPEQKGL
jgi:alpha,alpha-trehalase